MNSGARVRVGPAVRQGGRQQTLAGRGGGEFAPEAAGGDQAGLHLRPADEEPAAVGEGARIVGDGAQGRGGELQMRLLGLRLVGVLRLGVEEFAFAEAAAARAPRAAQAAQPAGARGAS